MVFNAQILDSRMANTLTDPRGVSGRATVDTIAKAREAGAKWQELITKRVLEGVITSSKTTAWCVGELNKRGFQFTDKDLLDTNGRSLHHVLTWNDQHICQIEINRLR
jgi:hypothetical protein